MSIVNRLLELDGEYDRRRRRDGSINDDNKGKPVVSLESPMHQLYLQWRGLPLPSISDTAAADPIITSPVMPITMTNQLHSSSCDEEVKRDSLPLTNTSLPEVDACRTFANTNKQSRKRSFRDIDTPSISSSSTSSCAVVDDDDVTIINKHGRAIGITSVSSLSTTCMMEPTINTNNNNDISNSSNSRDAVVDASITQQVADMLPIPHCLRHGIGNNGNSVELRERNIWLGQFRTSGIHFDGMDNIICVLHGFKIVHVYHPNEIINLYPGDHGPTSSHRYASIDHHSIINVNVSIRLLLNRQNLFKSQAHTALCLLTKVNEYATIAAVLK
jgi:hypothetical protein